MTAKIVPLYGDVKTWVILHIKLRFVPNAREDYVTQIQGRVYCDNVSIVIVSEKFKLSPQNFF